MSNKKNSHSKNNILVSTNEVEQFKSMLANNILLNWYLGGISYIIGALFYILRFPEKKFPGRFDYFGASHQIFHVLVFFGALFHFLGSLEAYNYRFRNLKIN